MEWLHEHIRNNLLCDSECGKDSDGNIYRVNDISVIRDKGGHGVWQCYAKHRDIVLERKHGHSLIQPRDIRYTDGISEYGIDFYGVVWWWMFGHWYLHGDDECGTERDSNI
jgi:hypothetical protein